MTSKQIQSTHIKGLLILSPLILSMLFTTACLENLGAKEVPKNSSASDSDNQGMAAPPTDFQVVPDQSGNSNPTSDLSNQPTARPPLTETELNQSGFEGLTINDQATQTNTAQLTLNFYTLNRNEMKITENANCVGGSWEPYTFEKSVTSNRLNSEIVYSVQYKDYDNMIGACFYAKILHDNLGPQIVYSQYPTTLEEGASTEIIYDVSDSGSGVDTVTCSINGLQRSCGAGRNTISLSSLALGTYTLTVAANDKLGNRTENTIVWNVASLYKNMQQAVRVKDNSKVDILIVDDNSGSMSYEQQSMASRVRNFLNVIQGLDYRIAITTTDANDYSQQGVIRLDNGSLMQNGSSKYTGDGMLLKFNGNNSYFIDSSLPLTTAQTYLGETIQRPEVGSGLEQGIRATYRAIERSLNPDSANSFFFRNDAQLAVVVISDEDESANTLKNDPQNLINLIHSTWNGQKAFSFHSIVTKTGDLNCKNSNGATYGTRYEQLSNLTGGIIGSVCESDYAAQLMGIADGVRATLKTVTLACAPITDRGFSVVITKNGVRQNINFRVEGVNLNFDQMLTPGDYNFDYVCLKQ